MFLQHVPNIRPFKKRNYYTPHNLCIFKLAEGHRFAWRPKVPVLCHHTCPPPPTEQCAAQTYSQRGEKKPQPCNYGWRNGCLVKYHNCWGGIVARAPNKKKKKKGYIFHFPLSKTRLLGPSLSFLKFSGQHLCFMKQKKKQTLAYSVFHCSQSGAVETSRSCPW